jgi:glutamate synthase domain-containing protein 3
MTINAKGKYFQDLNREIKSVEESEIIVDGVIGQRYIGSGLDGKTVKINGVPGNALGAYLNNCDVYVSGNAQDATGDTMNSGRIFIHGNSGDATGYAMRGGAIYVKGNVGYRAGVHIKSYKENKPVIVVGGKAGNFLGEYQAGGIIIVLNLANDPNPTDYYIANGMHGGEIYIRMKDASRLNLSSRLIAEKASAQNIESISKYLKEFAQTFGIAYEETIKGGFIRITPNTQNPYKQLYVNN